MYSTASQLSHKINQVPLLLENLGHNFLLFINQQYVCKNRLFTISVASRIIISIVVKNCLTNIKFLVSKGDSKFLK